MAKAASVTAIGAKPNFELVIVEDADHGFGGREEELGQLMVNWLRGHGG